MNMVQRFQQRAGVLDGKRTVLPTGLGKSDIHLQENGIGHLPNRVQGGKKTLTVDQTPTKCKC